MSQQFPRTPNAAAIRERQVNEEEASLALGNSQACGSRVREVTAGMEFIGSGEDPIHVAAAIPVQTYRGDPDGA